MSHKCVEEFSLQFPANARAPRSARVITALPLPFTSFLFGFDFFLFLAQKRRSFKEEEISENDRTCAIDLLATVAENLLSESEGDHCLVTQIHSVKEEFPVEEKPATLPDVGPYQGSMSPCGFSSVINGKVEIEAEGFSNSGAVVLDARPNGVGSLGGSSSSRTKVPSMGAAVTSRGALDDVNLFSRDDDENFSGYICPRVTKKPPRSVPRVGDRRIRKILASRHWKGGSRHSGSSNPLA